MDVTFLIDVTSTCSDWVRVCPTADRVVRSAAAQAFRHNNKTPFGLPSRVPAEMSVILADAAEQRRLNRDYRGHDTSTNVLAFPAWEPEMHIPAGAPILLGDVVLAFETVAREAAEQNKPISDHLSHLVVHGVLHLLGHDHLTQAEAAVMESLETSILAKLGVPDPYRDDTTSVTDSEAADP
jgi:probable rRNA maturation factor